MNISAVMNRRVAVTVAVIGLLAMAVGLLWWNSPERGTAGASGDELVLAQGEDEDEDEGEVAQLETVEVTYDFFLARDPFESIMPEPPPTDPADPDDPTDPDEPTDPSDPVDPDNGVCQTNQEAVCDGRVVALLDVKEDQATIEVDGTAYVVAPGQSFATNFLLMGFAEGDCVDVLYMDGDEADTFRICVGDDVVK